MIVVSGHKANSELLHKYGDFLSDRPKGNYFFDIDLEFKGKRIIISMLAYLIYDKHHLIILQQKHSKTIKYYQASNLQLPYFATIIFYLFPSPLILLSIDRLNRLFLYSQEAESWKKLLASHFNLTVDGLCFNDPYVENYLGTMYETIDQRHNRKQDLCFLLGFVPVDRCW